MVSGNEDRQGFEDFITEYRQEKLSGIQRYERKL